MRVAHFDCFSGISGDMVLGALVSAGVPVDVIQDAYDSLHLSIRLEIETVKRSGIAAIKANVIAPDVDDYRFLSDIHEILDRGTLNSQQLKIARAIFERLAQAEATVHGLPVEKVHFHEVGALDSIADIVGCAVGVDWLSIETFSSRSVPVGNGTVKCQHGIMPIPAPATAELLKGIPVASTTISGELTTPTGAAILATLVTRYQDSFEMSVERVGHGAGSQNFIDQPNLLRLFIGSTHAVSNRSIMDRVWVLETNIDDCPAEILGYTMEQLMTAGALDVSYSPLVMKKGRPGIRLTVQSTEEQVNQLERIIFQETGTFGIRRYPVERVKLQRESITIASPWGPIAAKRGWWENHQLVTPEYDECARIARQNGIPLREVYAAIHKQS
jgi:uncharacterized protein (TIGR00299 family) protein